MASLGSIYVSKENEELIEYLDRLVDAKGIPKNRLIMNILRDFKDNNTRYNDQKITDFETQSVLKVKKETELLFCDECGASLRDKDMWLIHHPDCSWNM